MDNNILLGMVEITKHDKNYVDTSCKKIDLVDPQSHKSKFVE